MKAAVTVLSLLPALDLWRDLQKLNRHWVTAYDYPVFSTGILVTGVWACIFLLIALAASPLQRILRMRWPAELRRTLGLMAFFYAGLHVAFYIVVGQKLRLDYVWADAFLVKSRLPGWGAFILLMPLAVTSTDGMLRWLGGKAWKRLHLLVFPAMALAIWHMSLTAGEHGQEDFHLSHNALIAFSILLGLRLLLQLQTRVSLFWKNRSRSKLEAKTGEKSRFGTPEGVNRRNRRLLRFPQRRSRAVYRLVCSRSLRQKLHKTGKKSLI